VCELSQSLKQQTEHYNWDAFGNPEVDYKIAKAERDTRIENDRLLCSAGVDYRYDKSGNQISSIATGLIQKRSFDGLNQLRQINSNDKLSQYQYDALGRRSAKITETGRTDFIWDGNQLIGEVSHGEYTWYIYLPDSFLPVALIKGNSIYYYHLDQLGTPVCLTDKNEQIVWQNQGDLFGDEAKTEQDSLEPEQKNKIKNPLRFQGQYFDNESGLHYNRFRYYCPKQGRFIHQDPIGLAGGINPYQYAPNPVNWIDPFGLSCKEDNPLTDKQISDILAVEKGYRPDPSTYLPPSYIEAHLDKFAGGASYLVPEEILNRFGRTLLGCPDNSQFVMSKVEMDDLIIRAKGDIEYIETELGIPAGSWKGQNLKRIDIDDPNILNLRMATGNEFGANEEWLPGGYLPTGYSEAVVDRIPEGKYTEKDI